MLDAKKKPRSGTRKHPAGGESQATRSPSVALRIIEQSDTGPLVVEGGHAWALNFELSANCAGFSTLLPLARFQVVTPVADDLQ